MYGVDENCIDSSNRRVFSKVSYGFGEKAVRGLGTKFFQETSLCDTSSAVDISSSTDSDYGAGFAAVFPAVEYSEDIDAYNEEEEKDEAGLEELLGFNSSPFLQSSSSRPSRMPLSASNARRVPKSELWMQEMMNETGEEEESVAVDAGEVSSTECDSCQSFLEAAERSVVRWADDVTICEAPHDNDIETETSFPPTPLDQSMLTEATTALTVEPVHTSCAHLALPPRLLLTSKMRHRSDFDDVKELLFSTSAGQATTIVLTFSNRKDRVMKLRSQAVLMRFDASQPYSSALPENSFSVHPQSLTALPNTEASLYVTFQPFGSGIYSGVLKIKCNKKSFTFLLRGENCLPQLRHDGAPNSLVATISQPEIRKALGDDEISISSTALKNRESIVAWIERSKGIQAPSSLYNPPTMLVVTPFKSNRLTQKEGQLVYHASIEFANHDRQKFVQPPNHCLITSPDCKRSYAARDSCNDVHQQCNLYMTSSPTEGCIRQLPSRIEPAMNVPSMPSSVQETSSNNCFTPASETHTRVSPNKSLSYTSGLYFKRRVADFGTILVGTLSRLKVELCNSTDQEIRVHLSDPPLPFVLLHNEVHLRPRSYARIPIRFIPVYCQQFSAVISIQSKSGQHLVELKLIGSASTFKDRL